MDKIVSRTKYDRRQHRDFYLFHMFHRNYSTYFMIALAIFVFIWAIINASQLTDPNQIMISWTMAAFTILIVPTMVISKINGIVKVETKKRKDSTDMIEVTKAKLQRSTDISDGKVVFGWNQIEIVCETKEYIYIYTGQNQGIFIVKRDMIEGSADLFRKLAHKYMKPNKKGKVKYKTYFRIPKDDKRL
ncbi:MAG: YcxB family protein [Bacilli bacterium]